MTTKTKFRAEFRAVAYSEEVISNSELELLMDRAKKHIKAKRGGVPDDFDFLIDGEEALFWFTCLFAKVATGELDSQAIQIGGIDQNALLAKDDDKVTSWYRNAISALRSLTADAVFQARSVGRQNRDYGEDGFSAEGETSEVDATDL